MAQIQAPQNPLGPRAAAPTKDDVRINAYALLQLHDQVRELNNLGGLTPNPLLQRAALKHAYYMAQTGVLDHTGAGNSTVGQRVTAENVAWTLVGENIAEGQNSPAEVMTTWMNSPGHRANILNGGFTRVGFGFVYRMNGQSRRIFWCAVFAN